ncbi:MoaD/ThiS family protein [bacterium]|nr:MoaD/ThiS family protein [bacterium]
MIRIMIPYHLGNLANIPREIEIDVKEPCTQRSILDTLESLYPVLRGTIRDHSTLKRRPFVRFFACGEDLSHNSPDAALPDAVVKGDEPFLIVGAMAGG